MRYIFSALFCSLLFNIVVGMCIHCKDLAILAENINLFQGKSIEIEYMRLQGKIHYIDISANGQTSESYGSSRVVNLELLLAVPGSPTYP